LWLSAGNFQFELMVLSYDQLPHIEMDCLFEFEPQTLYVYSL